jgi:hypothetical protein
VSRHRGRGRELFSGKPFSMWLIVARKRLPTPLRTVQPNPTLIVLPVLSSNHTDHMNRANMAIDWYVLRPAFWQSSSRVWPVANTLRS